MAGRLIGAWSPALDSSGEPISGSKLNTYQAGTTTPKQTFTSAALTTPSTNPVVADSAGRFPEIWAADGATYDLKWTDASGALIELFQDIQSLGSTATGAVTRDFGADGRFSLESRGGVFEVEAGDPSPDDLGGQSRLGGWNGSQGDTLTLDYATVELTGTVPNLTVTGPITAETGTGRFNLESRGGVFEIEAGDPSPDNLGGQTRIGGWNGSQGDALTLDHTTVAFTGTVPALTVTGVITSKTGTAGYGWNILEPNGGSGKSGFYAAYNSSGARIGYTGFYSGTDYNVGYTDGATPLTFGTNSTERIRVASDGAVIFGTSAVSSASELYSFYGNGSRHIVCAHGGSSWTNSTNFIAENDSGSSNFDFFGGYINGTAFARIAGDGSFHSALNSYGGISSREIKENIVTATPKLDDLNRVRVVNYNLIGDDLKQLGVIAEELAEIWPGLVTDIEERRGYRPADLDEHGNPREGAQEVVLLPAGKFVKYSVLSVMTIKAIQELSAKVDQLRADLDARA